MPISFKTHLPTTVLWVHFGGKKRLKLLEKYKQFVFSDDKALPIISNQKMNAYLKELGKFADIDESIPPQVVKK